MIVDTHMHVWNAHDATANPWRPGWARFAPRLAFSPEEAWTAMRSAGVDRALLVPPDWDRTASDLAGAAARAHPDRFLAFGSISLSTPLPPEQVSRFCLERGLCGLRQVVLPNARTAGIGSCEWLWQALEALGMHLMVWMPAQISALRDIVTEHPRLRVTVDHLNLPMATSPREAESAVDDLCALACHSNLAAKASALPALTRCGLTTVDAARLGRRVIDAFGPSRVFWGSDFLRLPCSYRDALSIWRDPAHFTAAESTEVLGEAAVRWFGWDSA